MLIKKNANYGIIRTSHTTFSNFIKIVWQTVRRINYKILRVKELK